MGKKKKPISKDTLKNADPSLLPLTQNIEENLARGESSVLPDPDDIPGGTNSTLTHLSPRADLEEAEAEASLEQSESQKDSKKRKK